MARIMPVIGQYAPLGLKTLFFTASIKTLGISPATMNVAPGYFNRKIKEK